MNFSDVSDAALPWVLLVGCLLAAVVGAALAVAVDRLLRAGGRRLAARLSGLPALPTPEGCQDCSAAAGEPHRHAGCPSNVRQCESGADRR